MNLIKKLGIITICAICTIGMIGCGDSNTNKSKNDNKTINVGTSADFPPYEFIKDGKIAGVEIDLVKEIAKNLNSEAKIHNMDFDGLLSAVTSQKVDIAIAGISVTEERQKTMDFSNTLFQNNVRIVSKKEVAFEKADDLKGKKIGYQTGTTSADYIKDRLKTSEGYGYKEYVQALTDLKNGKIDALVMDEVPANKMVKGKTDFHISSTILYSDEYAIATKKGTHKELLDEINAEIEKLKKNGKFEEIANKYF